ncbi:MAG: tetratricopeptide repeat protein [Desulfosporosinus sp.]
MAKNFQVLSNGTLLIKAPVQALEDELAQQDVTVRQALDYFILAEELSCANQNAEAGEAYEKSVGIFPSMSAFLNWGNVLFISGRTGEAHQSYFNGQALAEKKQNKWFESAFFSNIGHLYYSEGNPDEAIKYFNQALPVLKETWETKEVTAILLGILLKMEGIYNQQKEPDLAIECLQQALLLFRETGGHKGTAKCLNNLGLILVTRKDYDQALDNFREALDIFRKLGSRENEAEQLGNIGSVYRDLVKHDLALGHYSESLAIFEEIGHEYGIANQFGNIGYILFKEGDYYPALTYFQQAEKLYIKLGVASRAEMTRKNIDNLVTIML